MRRRCSISAVALATACQGEPLIIDVVRTFESDLQREVWACKDGEECRRKCGGWWPLLGECTALTSDVCGYAPMDAADELRTLAIDGDSLRVVGLGHDARIDLGPFVMPGLMLTSTTWDDGAFDVMYTSDGADLAVTTGGNALVGLTACTTSITGSTRYDVSHACTGRVAVYRRRDFDSEVGLVRVWDGTLKTLAFPDVQGCGGS